MAYMLKMSSDQIFHFISRRFSTPYTQSQILPSISNRQVNVGNERVETVNLPSSESLYHFQIHGLWTHDTQIPNSLQPKCTPQPQAYSFRGNYSFLIVENVEILIQLGTIQVLRHHVFDFFRPTHPPFTVVNHQKLPFSDPTHPSL